MNLKRNEGDSYVTHHAKASSAGSTEGNGNSRALFRRAFATRGASRSAAGSGAPSRRRPRTLLATLALAICAAALTAAPASAAPPTVLIGPVSAVSYASVHVSGEVDPGITNESGEAVAEYTFEVSKDELTWSPTKASGTMTALAPGLQSVSGDITGLKGATKYFVRLSAYNFDFFSGEGNTGQSPEPNPSFTTLAVEAPAVVSVDDASNVLAGIAKASGEVKRPEGNANTAFDVDCHFEYVADAGFQPKDEQQSLTVRAIGGTFTLSFEGQTTAPLAFDAPAATVQSALEGLSSVGAGNASVSGGPGDENGAAPYTIAFGGALGAKDVQQLSVDPSALSVEGVASAEVQTGAQGQPEGFNNPSSVPCKPANPVKAEGTSDVTGKLTGLQPGTTYHLRLHGENAGGTDTKVAADTFTTPSPAPAPSVTIDPVTTFTDASAHLSGKVDTHGTDTSWHFQCVPACGEPAGTLPADFSEEEVSANVSGLEPNTTYEVKLLATNAGGPGEATATFKTAFQAPMVQTGFATDVEATDATLNAKLNPHNSQVTYQFEYGTDTSYGTAIPVPAATLPEIDNANHDVFQELSGLAADTTYHYRLTAINAEPNPDPDLVVHGADRTLTTQTASGPKVCPNQQLRAENNSLALPDCRAYEQVSPVRKNGNEVLIGRYSHATADGNGILYRSTGAMGAASRGFQTFSVSHRSPDGWRTTSPLPAVPNVRLNPIRNDPFDVLPSADLTKLLFESGNWVGPENPEDWNGLYLPGPGGSVDWITHPQVPYSQPLALSVPFYTLGGSPDLSTFYFASALPLISADTARAATGAWGLYEYSGGVLRSAATLPPSPGHPEGTEPIGGAAPAASGTNAAVRGRGEAGPSPEDYSNQVSRDGSTLFFVSPDPFPGSQSGSPPKIKTQLYVRRGGHSTLVSHAEDGTPAPSGVTSFRSLTGGGSSWEGAQFGYASPDGFTEIFKSTSALTSAAPTDESVKAYSYDVKTDTVTYLPGVDESNSESLLSTVVAASEDGSRFLFGRWGDSGHQARIAVWDDETIKPIFSGDGLPLQLPARATASGSAFVFTTNAPIPGFNNGGPQIYRYDVAAQQLSCLSCPPDGVTPSGASLGFQGGVGSPEGIIPTRGVSTDADRVFFDTSDPLVPADVNGVPDVYEWTPGGVSLISSGQGKKPSVFFDSSADGSDVFFATADGLDPRDTDGASDVYDARVGGGFSQVPAVKDCDGNEVCKGQSPPAPIDPGPITESPLPSSNFPPCPKGKKRQNGKCVKPKKKKHHHKKAHKNKHKRAGHNRGGSK